ncbi:MFS transporter [Sutcliffiella cohnii]
METEKLWTKSFISVALSNFFVFVAFYYLLVIFPVYAITEYKTSETIAGLFVTVFILSAIIIRPIAGRWINTLGKRKVLMTSLFLFFIGSLLYTFIESVTGLLILRFFHGIGFGMITTIMGAIVADIIPEKRRGEGMGYYALTMNLAMVIGPFLGLTAIQNWGMNTTFLISVIFSFLALLIGINLLFEQKGMTNVKPEKEVGSFKIGDLFEGSAVRISLVAAFFAVTHASILSFVSVYAAEIGLVKAGSYFFVVYAVVLLISRPFTGKWYDRYGENAIIYPSLIMFAVGLFLLSSADSAFLFLLSAAFIGLGWGTTFPSLQTIAISQAPPHKRGLATATFLSIFDLGIAFGSFAVGIIGAAYGFGLLYLVNSFYVFIGIIVYYVLHGKLSALLRRKEAKSVIE